MSSSKTRRQGEKSAFRIETDSYKRPSEYVKSPFRYPGGKYYALRHIMPFIDCVPHEEFREPFIGGGSVFFAKPKSAFNWINDLETDLVATYRAIANPKLRKELCRLISKEIANPERHSQVKSIVPRSELEVAFKTFYLNRTSYSGIINSPAWGYAHGKSSPPRNWAAFIEAAGEKLADVKITNLDFEEVLSAGSMCDSILAYLDPPYFHADQKRAYTKSFELKDHQRLAKVLRKAKYPFCLSYDDCTEIRQLYSWAEIYEHTWFYNTANLKGGKRDKGDELLITNYKVIRISQGRLF